MNTISFRAVVRLFGFGTLATLLPGCTINDYSDNPPPAPPPQVEYVPAPPPPPPQPDYTPPPPQETVIVIRAESDFYEPLGRYGHWVDVGGYGRCWTPDGVDRDWRPYTQGHWERTDDGWYWASDEPWGWATCHYGRWFFDPRFGWIWVPETQWAPAWVAWRDGDDYTGWAPLPPHARFREDGRLQQDIDPHSFVFVEKRRLMEHHRPQTVIVNNVTVVQQTVNITKVTVVNKTVINEGPSPDAVQRAAGHPIHVEPAHVLRTQHEAPVAVREHLRTETVETGKFDHSDHGRSDRHQNDAREQKADQFVQPERPHGPPNVYVPPQHADNIQQPAIVAPPNQPRRPQDQPVPHPISPANPPKQPEQGRIIIPKNPQNPPKPPQDQQARQHEQEHQPNPDKRSKEPHPNQPIPEADRQSPITPKPQPKPEFNQPQAHPNPIQPKPEPDVQGRPPGQNQNEWKKPEQHPLPPQQKPEQKNPAQKPHPPEDKGHHSSTNAPPQQK